MRRGAADVGAIARAAAEDEDAAAATDLCADGARYDERAPEAAEYLQGSAIAIEVDLGNGGSGEARMLSCDLTAEYVRINAEYRT